MKPSFQGLFEQEIESLSLRDEARSHLVEIVSPDATAEPWAKYVSQDLVGLAFSGGGIRSATFNLGLLTGLQRLGLLKMFHYLSTVSGGGYVGGWWTAWLHRQQNQHKGDRVFPEASTAIDADASSDATTPPEPEEIRHLREFSNFLVPRLGFFEVEFWKAVVSVLNGLVPSMLAAAVVILIAMLLWLAPAWLLLGGNRTHSLWTMGGGLVLWFGILEIWWRKGQKADRGDFGSVTYGLGAAIAVALAVSGWFGVLTFWSDAHSPRLTLPSSTQPFVFNRGLLLPAGCWLALVGVLTIVIRLPLATLSGRVGQAMQAAFDRVLGRLIAGSVIWGAGAAIWELGGWLSTGLPWTALGGLAGTGSSAGIFLILRKLLQKTAHASPRPAWLEAIKPFLPQLAAYFTLVLVACLGVVLLLFLNPGERLGIILALLGLILVYLVMIVHPERVGLHEFYRQRICRAYLGASNPGGDPTLRASRNRQTEERLNDDILLADLKLQDGQESPGGPLHLICCAANELSSDPLPTLARGARSAVLSQHGLSIGDRWISHDRLEGITLSAALTASAAAFNPNMGSLSMRLGKAVTFLTAALNLRLGLWVREKRDRLQEWPGLFFFREMFGLTEIRLSHPVRVHLSDGAHFENLALYELIRRHCRYILLSDCGADPQVAFDDFANAQRRVREDFGVELEIDLRPLQPGPDGCSAQHMVVGTIHYDGPNGVDKGVLLYFKPSLTGDEPGDIQQYKVRNPEFPHESTGDQFYDEAQWESYRRLGEHAARSALRFVERLNLSRLSPHQFFSQARWEWYPTPAGLPQSLLQMTDRYIELEGRLAREAPTVLVAEVFPELARLSEALEPAAPTLDEARQSVHALLQVLQLMEDVWVGCSLETHANHPLNLGWVNLFQRWVQSPTFQMWWPVLRPLYSAGLRRFVQDIFGVHSLRLLPPPQTFCFEDPNQHCPPELLKALPGSSSAGQGKTPRLAWFSIDLIYSKDSLRESYRIDVGVARVWMDGRSAGWHHDEFWVIPGLWGGGIGGRFLDDLCQGLAAMGIETFEVTLPADGVPSDAGSRQARVDLMEFYKGAGFHLLPTSPKQPAVLSRRVSSVGSAPLPK
ncbi:MAG: hypothetical protein AB1898_21410 [Acidobacteriota bacterium]